MDELNTMLESGGIQTRLNADALPVLPDALVQSAGSGPVSQQMVAVLEQNYPSWEIAYLQQAMNVFDPDGIVVKSVAKSAYQESPAVLKTAVPDSVDAATLRGLQVAALYDLYVTSRLQEEGQPHEVKSSVPSWMWAVVGLALGGIVGYAFGHAELDTLLTDRRTQKTMGRLLKGIGKA